MNPEASAVYRDLALQQLPHEQDSSFDAPSQDGLGTSGSRAELPTIPLIMFWTFL